MNMCCCNCFKSKGIKKFIKEKKEQGVCDDCGNGFDTRSVSEVIRYIEECITIKKYQVDKNGIYNVGEVLDSENFESKTQIKTEIISKNKHMYNLRSEADIESSPDKILPLTVQWSKFKELIKSKNRFFSKEHEVKYNKNDQTYYPAIVLSHIEDFIRENTDHFLSPMKEGEKIFRARSFFEPTIYNAETLGPPPNASLISTRMTPLGISAFYGASTQELSIKEIKTSKRKFVVGEWTPFNVMLLNLSDDVSSSGDFFEKGSQKNILIRDFFNDFLNEMSHPIEKDKKEHIEYIPTQALVEWMKLKFTDIHGISYRSSKDNRNSSSVNICLFPERVKFTDTEDDESRVKCVLKSHRSQNDQSH